MRNIIMKMEDRKSIELIAVEMKCGKNSFAYGERVRKIERSEECS